MSKYAKLIERFQRLAQVNHALTFLAWDHQVIMPPGGGESRSKAIAELRTLHHELLTAPEVGDWLQQAASEGGDPLQQTSLKEMARVHRQATALPAKLVRAKSLAGLKCEHQWRSQRQENDWPGFLKNFREVVQLSRQEAQIRADLAPEAVATPYESLLELYCTGDSTAMIDQVFSQLKNELPQLIEAIIERQQSSGQPQLTGAYPIDSQRHLNHQLMSCLGFDFNCGRLDVSAHPFSTGARGDQRITTRFREDDFLDALMATAHESGHAAYENGLPEELDGLPVGEARNMGLHESQSLLFEKQIFLSRPFFNYFAQKYIAALPGAGKWTADQLWRAAAKVTPSYIRVEADEVTYPLHVILRYEIEKDLINGVISPEDLPELWDQKMTTYLGLSTAGNYRDGCMQDIHWTDGAFGYFPSYTLGALNAAQLFATVKIEIPSWEQQLADGEVGHVKNWLKEKIWSKASTLESQELIRAVTGKPTSVDSFLAHLRRRYLEEAY